MTLCVYALVPRPRRRSTQPLRIRGMEAERLRLSGAGAVQAVTGILRRVPAASPDALRRYDRTLHALASSLPALLPARFGTCFDDAGELEFVLQSRAEPLQRALAHVRGRAQMTVRVVGLAEARTPVPGTAGPVGEAARTVSRPGGRDASASRAGGSGSRYLRARAEAAARERQVPGFAPVRRTVERWIRDERVEKRGSMATVYHLVPRATADAYRGRVERAAAAAGLQVIVTGPWPPYAFARW